MTEPLLGSIEVLLNRHTAAIPLLEKAAAMEGSPGSRAGIYRNLTISYAEVGRYQDAYDVGGKAVSLSKALFADPDFMYAVAKADCGLGKFTDAQTAIRVIAAKRPQVTGTKDFHSAVEFVVDKTKQAQDKSPAR
jgi:tetratricopeptide (TPR) repeat protein